MARRRPSPDPDRIIGARLAGTASRHATSGAPDAYESAMAELRAIAGDRPDLLAKEAGLIWGCHVDKDKLDWPRREREVVFLLDAGAHLDAVPQWFEVGHERARQSWVP